MSPDVLSDVGCVRDVKDDVGGSADTAERDIQLAVGEDGPGQQETDLLETLALGLVNAHGEGRAAESVRDGERLSSACDVGEVVVEAPLQRRSLLLPHSDPFVDAEAEPTPPGRTLLPQQPRKASEASEL
eukprot:CAMPEP_0118915974 /NCGR_PEP_ID=MMETSP1166-20130328/16080_1 /TAXON_ID=1104430 /ORGANISM="Chrysoreinhardia sp, Strain CCMP3193" /LENGTH=129 /DNA_ID=CAMNT_0006855757 /DNA_START=353 /DNA_END=742 /DNA_ORIENTATION=-